MKVKGNKMSIWKTPDQKPEERRQILFYAGCGGLLNKGWYYTKNDAFGSYSSKNVQKWAYVDELFAQADKAERLQKAVDKALDTLDYVSNEKFATKDGDFFEEYEEMHKAIKQDIDEIKQLIKGE